MTSKPRVYIAISTFHPIVGGAERQALLQARVLHAHGYQVTVVTLRQKFIWPPYQLVESVPVIRVAGRFLSGREQHSSLTKSLCYALGLCIFGWTLWQKRSCYDLLHVYHLNLFSFPAALVSFVTRKPLIVGIRSASNDPLLGAEDGLSLLSGPLQKNAPWLRIPGVLQLGGDLTDLERLGPLVVRLMYFLLARPHVVVTVLSSRMHEYLHTHHFALPNTQFIPNGVDVTRFTPGPLALSSKYRAQTVVCVSKLCYRKGSDVLLQAWRYVQKEFPHAHLYLVGDGSIKPQLQRLAQELGIAETVEFVGIQENILTYLHRAAIAVLPSRIEGMPNAVLEAMACGLACVATRVSGSEDIVQSGVNGLLVESEDYKGLALALLSLLRDPALMMQYGQSARVHVEQCYSLEHVTDSYQALYQRLVDDRSHSEKQSYWELCVYSLRRSFGRILRYVWNSRIC
jgi:glycosyltransferase involved in cell wall biosynthesis